MAESRATNIDEEEEDAGVMGKRKGTPPVMSFNSTPGINVRKTRTRDDTRDRLLLSIANVSSRSQHSGSHARPQSASSDGSTQAQAGSRQTSTSSTHPQQNVGSNGQPAARNISLCTSFAELTLTPKQHRKTSGPKSSTRHRPSLSPLKEELSPSKIPKFSCTPSLRHAQSMQALRTPSPLKQKPSINGLRTPITTRRRKDELPVFLTKEKLTPTAAWDTKGRLEDMESLYATLRTQFAAAADSKSALEESLSLYKSRGRAFVGSDEYLMADRAAVQELTELNRDLSSTNKNLNSDLERARSDLHATISDLRQARRDHERDTHDLERKHERELNDLYAKQEKEGHRLERELEKIAEQGEREIRESKRAWEKQKDDEISDLTTRHWEEMDELKTAHKKEIERLQGEVAELRQSGESRATESATEVQALRDSLADMQGQLDAAKTNATTLRSQVSAAESRNASLEQEKTALISKTHFLEGNQEAQSLEFTTMSEKLQEAIAAKNGTLDTLRKEEVLRRKLNATILELRGNIRVFVRTRPLLAGEEQPAKVDYPDLDALDGGKEMVVHAPTTLSVTGKERNEKHTYAFDRVFNATAANSQVFDDCRDLIQSVVDGYNVSILSYGQTGSGKTFGMSGPDGIIPSAIALLLSEMARLKEKGWEYSVEANFVEVYNETLNDLLGDAKTWDDADDLSASVRGKKREKHEIHHDSATGKTTVTNLSSVSLWPPPENEGQWPPAAKVDIGGSEAAAYTEKAVNQLLDTAAKSRRVAATKANERSSRSHSIFILTLKGHCAATNESSEGILNLVDLAGSERLKQSGAEGNRMKETQAINKSLSSLGDVIAALGSKKGDESHVPYRNSKVSLPPHCPP